jgi:ubiquinol-cytochrome c reductase cytochrome c1 subunit
MIRYALCVFIAGSFIGFTANAASDVKAPIEKQWSFDGITGTVDRQSAQRGYQVYKEVCAACHSLRLIPFRTLEQLGFSEAEIKTLAASYEVQDGPNDDGEMFMRPARPSDRLPSPYPNEQAARAVNNGAYPADLSLMVKARPGGANYVYSLLVGYENAPEGFELGAGMHYNPYFPGAQIAMPSPLMDGLVGYADGTEASVEQMAADVANFLQWTAEPEMEKRKRMGIKVMIYLVIFTLFFYYAKRSIWSRIK